MNDSQKKSGKTGKKSSKNSQKQNSKNVDTNFWKESGDNVKEGANIITTETKLMGKRFVKYSETLLGKIKDHTNDLFKYGLDLTHDGVHKAEDIAESLKNDFDMKKLNAQKKEVASELGMKFYHTVKKSKNKDSDNLLKNREINLLLKELEKIDKEILIRQKDKKK